MDGAPQEVTQAYEAAIREADEQQLMRKFGMPDAAGAHGAQSIVEEIEIVQGGTPRRSSVSAFAPLDILVRARRRPHAGFADLTLTLTRVDGRLVWRQSLSDAGLSPPEGSPLRLCVAMSPFILGAGLYRLDVVVDTGRGPASDAARVFEVVDEEGQYGGTPLIYYDPVITSRPAEEA
ncbi:MAG: hypothetical protein JNK46_06675 [Methylobacteriaceae bacterium]|nr:hypothetical protein [Methylobacteriaceae bacterium]